MRPIQNQYPRGDQSHRELHRSLKEKLERPKVDTRDHFRQACNRHSRIGAGIVECGDQRWKESCGCRVELPPRR
jgi:hypothetical protein